MSAVDGLIVELCPDGVEYRKILSVTNVLYGAPFASELFGDVDGMPLIRIRDILRGSTNTRYSGDFDSEYVIHKGDILVGMDGDFNVGKWRDADALLNQRVLKIESKDLETLDNTFLYHLLGPLLKRVNDSILASTVKHLTARIIDTIEIPVPPIEIQREIAHILDAFAALTDELTAKLAEEATDRKRQYGYYRDRLLSRENLEAMDGKPVEMVRLGDSCSIYDGDHAAPPKSVDGIPFVTISDVKNGRINLSATRYVSKDYYDRLAIERKPLKGDFLYTVVGTLGEIAAVDTDKPFVIQRHMAIIRPLLNNGIAPRYLFHLMQASYIKSFLIRNASGAAQKTIGLGTLRSCEIPVPSPATQQKVVDILDRFDALTASLTDGLPAEIEARKAQYGYYRDRLLDFPRKGSVTA